MKLNAIELLKQLITIPSFSKEEAGTASAIVSFLEVQGIATNRAGNNVWAINRYYDPVKPTLLLNSHHDTVRPNAGYTRDPFVADIVDGKLYGLGSNDAGGALVALVQVFLNFYDRSDLNFNLVLAATAEEEISGSGGVESIWPLLPRIDFALVGEPTALHLAVAEKGLLVLDCVASGRPGHAAREEGVNAIYNAMEDIAWFRSYKFDKVSPTLGEIKMTVTVIQAGQQHNVVPAQCNFTVDVRVTDAYSLEEVLDVIKSHVQCSVTTRSMRIRPSSISEDNPLLQSAKALNIKLYGSPTTSDQALIPVPSVKMGPGDSARSHTANEFIFVTEIEKGIEVYSNLLNTLNLKLTTP